MPSIHPAELSISPDMMRFRNAELQLLVHPTTSQEIRDKLKSFPWQKKQKLQS